VDFYDTTIFASAATLSDDGNHANGTGYDRIARIWFAALETRLA
jgi:lysophospholipase L1-like esterase